MKRIIGLVCAVALLAAVSSSVFAQSAQPVDRNASRSNITLGVNPTTGEQRVLSGSSARNNGDVVYDNYDIYFDRYFTSLGSSGAVPNRAFADDLLLDKSKNPGAGLATLQTYAFVPSTIGVGQNDIYKIDIYAAQVGPYANLFPATFLKIATSIFTLPGSGTNQLFTLTSDFTNGGQNPGGLVKPNQIWVSLQSSTGRSGPILKDSLPIVGTDWLRSAFPTLPSNRGYFAINVIKDNDNGWGCCYSFGGPAKPYGGTAALGDFAFRLTNTPEPATMAFAGAAALAFFRRRR